MSRGMIKMIKITQLTQMIQMTQFPQMTQLPQMTQVENDHMWLGRSGWVSHVRSVGQVNCLVYDVSCSIC